MGFTPEKGARTVHRLTVSVRRTNDTTVITLAGEIDFDARSMLADTARHLPPAPGSVCLDLSRVTFMDSSGLHFLLRLDQRVGQGRLRLVGVQEQPRRVLTLTGLDRMLALAPQPQV